ncbi:hypothetical protein MKW98_030972 [Papaver atlanticum]|uniref:Translation elongation factor EF1B beta/delta subunit guanine nucleotide exchange domain-containing protein n=1 Tax=Papaver atlanticum TaxID=357466 RepID=A0AAD4S6Q3_9MAGN|nr:hypothetical protein MKW98_030972 [Papaver atlanticum]
MPLITNARVKVGNNPETTVFFIYLDLPFRVCDYCHRLGHIEEGCTVKHNFPLEDIYDEGPISVSEPESQSWATNFKVLINEQIDRETVSDAAYGSPSLFISPDSVDSILGKRQRYWDSPPHRLFSPSSFYQPISDLDFKTNNTGLLQDVVNQILSSPENLDDLIPLEDEAVNIEDSIEQFFTPEEDLSTQRDFPKTAFCITFSDSSESIESPKPAVENSLLSASQEISIFSASNEAFEINKINQFGSFNEGTSSLSKDTLSINEKIEQLQVNATDKGKGKSQYPSVNPRPQILSLAIPSVIAMAVTFYNLSSKVGLENLDNHLKTRSYITGYQASKDDITVHAALKGAPSSEFINVSRWFNHIEALLRISGVSAEGSGVSVEGFAPVAEESVATPSVTDAKPAEDDDDDSDVDLFGEETEEEKKAAEERAAAVKASGKKKESGKSSILLDVKPWDDETDMAKLEETVRSVQMEGLTWGMSKLVAVGYGIKKLQIMMTIVDDLVSIDSLIEDHLTSEPANEYIQSCDIVAFNKI